MISAGIDVSAKQVDVVIHTGKKPGKSIRYNNDGEGHHTLIKALNKRKVTRVCLEATGVYHIDLAFTLAQMQGLEIMVLNPKAAKNYAQARLTRSKTDAIDATLLSEFAQHMPFQPWSPPRLNVMTLRACARRLAMLGKQRTQAKNQLHALRFSQHTPGFVVEDALLSIEQLGQQIERLRAKALELIGDDAQMQGAYRLLCSVKGIAEVSAIALLGELLILPEDMSAKQWVAMAGLDPRHFSSGSSVNKKPRISKVGNRYLRMALYMPALSASQTDKHVSAYYQHLIEDNGLKKLQAICAVMRKLLHAIWGMFQSGAPFDNRRFYAIPDSAVS